jgi:Domain of unknown function (DUF6456)
VSGLSAPKRLEERAARVLAGLAAPGHVLQREEDRYVLRLDGERAPRLVADATLVAAMLKRDWLRQEEEGLVVSETGLAWLRRRAAGADPWRGQHLALETMAIETTDGGRAEVTVVVNESPLAWLRHRRGADGRPLVSETQFTAGERLRADFERGNLGPRVTADWSRGSLGRRQRGSGGSPGGGAAEFADAVVTARGRVDAVLKDLGPDLGGLLLDVCCFLTGIEDAERRRGWPRRSAKVVLGIALDRLAAHYGLSDSARGRDRSRHILHWGDEGYRPSIDGGVKTGPVGRVR